LRAPRDLGRVNRAADLATIRACPVSSVPKIEPLLTMSATRLVKPTTRLEKSHRSLIRGFAERNEALVPWVLAEARDDFEEYVSWLERHAERVDLAAGFVPSTTLWLIDAADEIVVVSNLRHELTPFRLDYGGHIGFGVRPSAKAPGFCDRDLEADVAACASVRNR
jgi:predicted acetyltransferase